MKESLVNSEGFSGLGVGHSYFLGQGVHAILEGIHPDCIIAARARGQAYYELTWKRRNPVLTKEIFILKLYYLLTKLLV